MNKARILILAALAAAFFTPADLARAVTPGDARIVLTELLFKECVATSRLNYAKAFCRCDVPKRIARLSDTDVLLTASSNAAVRQSIRAKIGSSGDNISLECTASAGYGYCLDRNRKVLPAAEAERFCRCMDRKSRSNLAAYQDTDAWLNAALAQSAKHAQACRAN